MFILKESAESDARDTFGDEKYLALEQAGYKFIKTIWGSNSDGDDIEGWLVRCPDNTKKEISFEDLDALGDEALKTYVPPKELTTEEEFNRAILAVLKKYDSKYEVQPNLFKGTFVVPFVPKTGKPFIPDRQHPEAFENYNQTVSVTADFRNLDKPIIIRELHSKQEDRKEILENFGKGIYLEYIKKTSTWFDDLKKVGVLAFLTLDQYRYENYTKVVSQKLNSSGIKELLEQAFLYSFKVPFNYSSKTKMVFEKLFKHLLTKKETMDEWYIISFVHSSSEIALGTDSGRMVFSVGNTKKYCGELGIDFLFAPNPPGSMSKQEKLYLKLLDSFTEEQIKNAPMVNWER